MSCKKTYVGTFKLRHKMPVPWHVGDRIVFVKDRDGIDGFCNSPNRIKSMFGKFGHPYFVLLYRVPLCCLAWRAFMETWDQYALIALTDGEMCVLKGLGIISAVDIQSIDGSDSNGICRGIHHDTLDIDTYRNIFNHR